MTCLLIQCCCYLLLGHSTFETVLPDWHTSDFPSRNSAMWLVISRDSGDIVSARRHTCGGQAISAG